MGNDFRFVPVPGSAPAIISADSWLDELLEESDELTSSASAAFLALKDILAFGGEKIEISIQHSRETKSSTALAEPQSGKPVFDVLSLDLASIFPALPGKGYSRGTYRGRQICFCRSPASSNLGSNWYKSALDKYFSVGSGGSLLSFPEIRKNHRTWWVLRSVDTDCYAANKETPKASLSSEFIWKSEFDPKKTLIERESSEERFKARFNQFGEEVFASLTTVQTADETRSAIIIWIYVGPSESSVGQITQGAPSWGVSLFATIRPTTLEPSTGEHWLSNSKLQDAILKAVNQLYLSLASTAYKTLEYRRLMDKAFEILQSAGFVFGHDLKNRLEEMKYEEVRLGLRGLKHELSDLMKKASAITDESGIAHDSNDLCRALRTLRLGPLDLADACFGKLAAFSATPELFRVMAKFVSGELPYEWAQKDLVASWPENFSASKHLIKAAEACDIVVRQVVSSYIDGLEFELRRIDGQEFMIVPPINSVNRARIDLPPLSNSPSLAPPYAILAGLSELVRNAVRAVTSSAVRGDIKHNYGKLHLDYTISIDKEKEEVCVSIWNPYSGQAPLVSETINYMIRMYEQIGAVEITPVRDNPHPLIQGLRYGQSDFVLRPKLIRFAKRT